MTCHLQPKGRATRTSAGGRRVTSLQFMAAAVLAVGVGVVAGNAVIRSAATSRV